MGDRSWVTPGVGFVACMNKRQTHHLAPILLTTGRKSTIGTVPFRLAERTAPGYYQGHLWQGLR